MAHCINTNLPEYKNLKAALGNSFSETILKAAVAVWQERNGLENWPTIKDLSTLISKPNSFNIKNEIQYQLPQGREQEEFVASEKTIRDLAARMSNFDLFQNVDNSSPFEKLTYNEQQKLTKKIKEISEKQGDRIGIRNYDVYNSLMKNGKHKEAKEYKKNSLYLYKIINNKDEKYRGVTRVSDGILYINLAYATLDTPIHEILGHPIVRAIKNIEDSKARYFLEKEGVYKNGNKWYHLSNNKGGGIVLDSIEEVNKFLAKENTTTLYQNLLKELEYGKGKEVLDRIKRDYQYKEIDIIQGIDGKKIFSNQIKDLQDKLKHIPINKEIDKSDLSIKYENGYSIVYLKDKKITTLKGNVSTGYSYSINNETYKTPSLSFQKQALDYIYNTIKESQQKEEEVRKQISKEIETLSESFTVVADTGNTKKGKYFLSSENSEYQNNFNFKDLVSLIGEENLPKYSLEEQQEEAIVELLGLYTAGKLDNVKDGKLISLLKRLLKEMKAFMKQLLGQKEIEIDKLPDNMTLGNIADLLAYSNSKLILPGNEVIYTTPDNQQFKTYQEASNHISQLAKSVKDVDLSKSSIFYGDIIHKVPEDVKEFYYKGEFGEFGEVDLELKVEHREDGWYSESPYQPEFVKITDQHAFQLYTQDQSKGVANIKEFIEKNKEYEQSKEIIEEWKRVNNIQYNPEEVYSKGQEFVSIVGAYSNFDVNLMMQNLLQHIEDNQKADGEFTVSAFTKPVDKQIDHLEGGGGKIKFKIYPQSQDIKWAANTDVYSGSVWDASEKVNKDKKSELLGVSYTKYPSLRNINEIQPNLANIIDNLAHHHNELGISLTGSNFRLEYDKDIPYSTKKIIDSINSILDQKYGKVVKPVIENKSKNKEITLKEVYENIKNDNYEYSYQDDKYFNKLSREFNLDTNQDYYELKSELLGRIEEILKVNPDVILESGAKQPTQTNKTLKESIDSVKNKIIRNKDKYAIQQHEEKFVIYDLEEQDAVDIFDSKESALQEINKLNNQIGLKEKEYTGQALINTKIAKLKEVAKKYPRSLIRSEVRPINSSFNLGFTKDELPFQKVSNGEISYSLDDIAGVNYQDMDFPDIDVDAILAESGVENGSNPDKTERFGIVKKTLFYNIKSVNNRISQLRDRIRKANPGVIKDNLTKQLVLLEEQLEKYQLQMDEFKDVEQIEQLRGYAEQDIERVKEILAQPNITTEDIHEARRLVGLWANIGDFTPNMAENHPLFTAEELQMNSLKYGFNLEDGTHVKGFAEYKTEMDVLGKDIEFLAKQEVVRFVRNTLKDQTISPEVIFKGLEDLNLPSMYLLSLGRVPDALAQSIAAAFRKIEAEAIRETQERVDRLDSLYKKVKNKLINNAELFKQKFKNGQLTGGIVDRIAPEFAEERDDLYNEARADKTGSKWSDYFNWIKTNTIYFDVRLLFDSEGNPLLTPESEAHKEELIKHLGEKGFEVYYDKQRRRINSYFEAKLAFEAALEDKKDLKKGQKMIALRNWEAINSPFINLDRILDNKVINVDGKPVKSRNNYNLYVPRKFKEDGNLTGYYDANYQTIESDSDLFAYYEEVVNTLAEVRSYLSEEERRKLQTNSLPYILNNTLGMYNEGGLKLGASAASKILQKLYTQTGQSEIEFGEQDLGTHSVRNTPRMAFADKTNKMITTRLQMQIADYVKKNQTPPSREIVLEWRRAIKDELAKEKSWDINNIMKVYITSAMAYKHKSASTSILNLAEVALLQKGGVKSPGDARSVDIYGKPLTQQSIKNLSELLAYTSDVFYGMPKHAIEGKITQVVVQGYEKEFKRLNDAIATNQDNYDKKLITEVQYSRNKKMFERELKVLQTNISVSSLADGFLKYGQVVGMGYNVIAGVVNLMVGSLENATRSADASLLSPKALSLAYKDVIQIIGNKSTPIGRKVINLNTKLNITKTAQNELYDNTSEFWKKFKALSPFKITEKTEMVNQLPLAFALMRSKTSYNDKGEEISMWEAFDNNGEVKDGYVLSKEMTNEEAISQYQLQVSELINQTHGNYDISSPILAKKFIMGRLGMQFRTWMPEMAMRRWGAERDDKILGIKTKGRWRSYKEVWRDSVDKENPDISYTKLENALYASKMLIRKVLFIPQYKYAIDAKGNKVSYKEAYDSNGRLKTGYKPVRAFDTRMSDLDAQNMRANLVEVALLIQMYLTKLLILAVMPDLDDDKKRIAIGMLNIGKRLRSDILMFANPVEYEKLNKNLLPISQYLKHIGSWGYDVSKFLVSWDDDSWRDVVKQTGIITPLFSQGRRLITYTDKQFTN